MMDCISESSATDIEFQLLTDRQVLASGVTVSSSIDPVGNSLATIDFDPFGDGELSLTAPATESQQEIWLGAQLSHEANLACLLSQSLRLTGRLNIDALQAALSALVSRHESLRTTFSGDGTTILINKTTNLQFPVIDCSEAINSSSERLHQREHQLKTERDFAVSIPFDLTHGPLFTAKILRFDDSDHALILTVHHIICDGWSLGILGADLARLYTAIARDVAPDLEPPAYFSEYAFLEQAKLNELTNTDERSLIDEDSNVATVARSEIEAYWLQKFANLPPVVDLPADYSRPPLRTFNAAHEYYQLPASLVRSLEQVGIANGCSLMTTLLAAFEVFLSKITDRTELVVGVPTSGQIAAGKDNLVGHCVNFLPCRSRIDPQLTFTEYLRSRNTQILDDYEHQDFTFGSLLKKLAIARDASRMPLISAVFNIDLTTDDNPGRFDRLTVDTVVNHSAFATFEFFLNAATTSNGQLNLDCQYNTNLFSTATIQRRLAEFENILHQIIEPATRFSRGEAPPTICQLSLLSLSAEYQLLVTWNDTKTDYPRTQCVHQLFEQRVKIAGDAIALVSAQQQLTYHELNQRSNQLANYLLGLGVQPGELIGIAMPRSIDTIVAILGILKAGCAYVPLDLTYPLQRLSVMVEDARVSILVTTTAASDRLPTHQSRFVHLDTDWDEIATASTTNPQVLVDSTSLAYVMYTSGSTGQPKGVCVPHQGVVRLVTATNYIDFSPELVFLQLAPISFDAATFEIWGSLLNGAKLVLFPSEKPSLAELGQTIQQHQITTLWLTAGLFHLMVDERLADLQPLRQLIAGGDVLSVPHVQKVLATLINCQLINGYGPTENTTFTCCYPIVTTDRFATSIPIGRPIANTQVYILNADRQPVPIGVPGELYIGGDGLAQGYLDRPDLTQEKFIPNPFTGSATLYQTGDLARYLPDGNIEFLGRIDNQVKIRGFRVELGEIEAAISEHPHVREVRVIDAPPPGALSGQEHGDKRLVAYIVATAPDEAHRLSHRELRTFLQSRLPDYAIPSAVVMVAAFPLTPNGKVDRRALPLPDDDRRDDTIKVSPRDELELQLTKIWERVLGIQSIGIHDNFFELGGHSLIAVRLFAEIDRVWGQNLPLSTLFQAQTIEELASVIRQQEWIAPWSSLVLMQPGGSKPPIFCIHPIGGNILEYYALAHYLGREQPIYGLQSQGLDGRQQPLLRVEDMASHYIREMRAVQPHGPYFLIGYSFGGLVAFEIACQLNNDNEKIELLALLDCSSPNLSKLRPSVIQSLKIHLCNLWQLSSKDKIDYIIDRILYRFSNDNERDFLIKSLYKPQDLTTPLLNILNTNLQASENYVARSYLGKLTLFRCQVQDLEHHAHSELGWSNLVGTNLDIYHVPEIHFKMMKEPNISVIAEKIKSCLQL
jgi:amino acid adenylation domain-containing protein